jgi:16S rRNA (uracil1498-N3)-methyltransferase
VGPEGGLDGSEADALAAAGAKLVSLGPRILRTENAPVVAAAAVLFHYWVIG